MSREREPATSMDRSLKGETAQALPPKEVTAAPEDFPEGDKIWRWRTVILIS